MELRMILRSLVITTMIMSWLAISNHCALAALSPPSPAAESCPMHPQPAKEKGGSGLICCKILRASTAPAMMKAAAPMQLLDLFASELWTLISSRDLLEQPVRSLVRDTGPPGPVSYAELVLQQSLRAHAPPSLG